MSSAKRSKSGPDAIFVNEGANTLDLARGVIDMYKPRKRLDVGTWGIMGIGRVIRSRPRSRPASPCSRSKATRAFGFSGMEVETICRYKLPVCIVIFNNDGIYRGTDVNTAGSDPAHDRVREGRALRQDDRGLRRRRRQRDLAGRARRAINEAMDSGKPTLINAVIDPAAGSESGRIGNLNPQSVLKKK